VDVVVIGEGEATFRELVLHGLSKDIKGLAYKDGSGIVFTGERPVIIDVNSIDFPLRSLRPERYGEKGSEYSIDTIYTSRGCPWTCSFCANDQMHKHWRGRSPENVVEELSMLHDPKKKKHIKIWDANFLTNIKRAEQICDLLIEKGLTNFKFGTESRVKDVIRGERILPKLRQIGLHLIGLGIESPHEKTLSLMNKNNNLEEVKYAIELTRKNGISTEGYFIVGHYSETIEDTMAYPEFAKSLGLSKALFMVMTPYPGTKVFHEYQNAGNIVSYDWDLYNNYSPVVKTACMDALTIVKIMAYCTIAFSGYRSVLRRNSKHGILADLLSRLFSFISIMKVNKSLTENEVRNSLFDAFLMYQEKNPVIESEDNSFSKKQWMETIVISLEHSPGKAIDFVFEQHGIRRNMSIVKRDSEIPTPNAVISLDDLIAFSRAVSIDWMIKVFFTGEILKNNPHLLLNSARFVRQLSRLLADRDLWRISRSAVLLYSGALAIVRSR
jgi:magnesium-protoporphyrin IX monomethyl ester (oxidative) cyclase